MGSTEGTAGGPSLYEPRPFDQFLVKDIVGSLRGTPDVAAVADPFYRRLDLRHEPLRLAGRRRNQRFHSGMGGHRQRGGRFNNSTSAELAQIYASTFPFPEAPRRFTDITSGACGIGPDFEGLLATEGWDFCTGVGSPLGYFAK